MTKPSFDYHSVYSKLIKNSKSRLIHVHCLYLQSSCKIWNKTNGLGKPAETNVKTRLKVVGIYISHHVTIVTLARNLR